MSANKKLQKVNPKPVKYRPLTVADFEETYSINLEVDPKMRLSTYAKKINQPNMGKLLEKVEKNLAKAS